MANILPSAAKLISTNINPKSGTAIKKFALQGMGEKAVATVVNYGKNVPIKQAGIDTFVKIEGTKLLKPYSDKALLHGDEVILSGVSKGRDPVIAGDFNSRYKTMIDLLREYPKLKAELISNTGECLNANDIIKKVANLCRLAEPKQ